MVRTSLSKLNLEIHDDEIPLRPCGALRRAPALRSRKENASSAPKSKWQPRSALESQLQADGYSVRQIKVEGGCYEVYATDKDGQARQHGVQRRDA